MAKNGKNEMARAKTTVSYERNAVSHVTFAGCLMALVLSAACWAITEGDSVNVTPFGEITKWDADGKDYGVIWEDSRDIFQVVVRFADVNAVPKPEDIRLQYWQSTWPNSRIPRNRPSGAGDSGWLNIGDWFQGKWLKADTNLEVNDTT
ncbi:MAG: hypothetical protein NTX52_10145, partial [Planctomycetota bacterium]|nr:hypothetical protein [Planctomycetota bacterium]